VTAANRLNLKKIVSQLSTHYGPPRPALTTDPFALILLENIAYLVSDSRREEAFKLLRKDVGTKPHEILTAANKIFCRRRVWAECNRNVASVDCAKLR
jgi:hypothetical protein